MAGPIIPPFEPPPAINKTYSDIKFFLKTPETTKAFVNIPFTGAGEGYPLDPEDEESELIPYPNEDFDNENTGVYPFIDLPNLVLNYELKAPTYLGIGFGSDNIASGEDIFIDIEENTYLLYRNVDEALSDANGLRVLGFVASKTSNSEVILTQNVPNDIEGEIEIFSWEGENNDETLNVLNFKFQDNFYMVVKNADYTAGNHNAILQIDTAKTVNTYTTYPQPFAYSVDKITNPTYFNLERISKSKDPLTLEPVAVKIPCSIKGVSKWSEKFMFEGLQETISPSQIPYWSVYEIDPQPGVAYHLDKKTFYRLTVKDSLPSWQVKSNYVAPPSE